MKKASIFFLAAITVTLVFFGCNTNKTQTDPIDTEPPVILMSSPDVVPRGSYVTYTSLNDIPFDIRFEDNEGLRNYQINLEYAQYLYYAKTDNFPWEKLIVGDLDGRVDGYNDTLTIPFDPSTGPHILTISAWDLSGNRSDLRTYLFIRNANDVNPPSVSITMPTAAVDTVTIGQNLTVMGTLSESGGLVQSGRIQIRNQFNDMVEEWSVTMLDSINAPSYPVDTFINIPAGVAPGDYILEIYGRDYTQNFGSDTQNFYIKN